MNNHHIGPTHHRKGAATVMALVFLVLFASLAVTFTSASFLELRKSRSVAGVASAQLAAESGLSYMLYVIRNVTMEQPTTDKPLTECLCDALNAKLADVKHLGDEQVIYASTTTTVPSISLNNGSSFQAKFLLTQDGADKRLRMTVCGSAGGYSRNVAVDLSVARAPSVFDYGVASRGQINIQGNGWVSAADPNDKAKILSTRGSTPAIQVSGSGRVDGPLCVTGATKDYVVLGANGGGDNGNSGNSNGNSGNSGNSNGNSGNSSGNSGNSDSNSSGGGGAGGISVNGSSNPTTIMAESVKLNVSPPTFPEINTAPLIDLAVNAADESTLWQGSNLVYDNLRIPKDTNPTFKSDAVINGVLYIEAPNVVTFQAGVTINGVIVTQKDPNYTLSDCKIEFRGHASVPGVGSLSADSTQFDGVRQYLGTAILAPGFSLEFRGNTGTVNGIIAADKVEFQGNSNVTGDLTGCILGLKDEAMLIHGSSHIDIRPLAPNVLPAGFITKIGLRVVEDSYVESSSD